MGGVLGIECIRWRAKIRLRLTVPGNGTVRDQDWNIGRGGLWRMEKISVFTLTFSPCLHAHMLKHSQILSENILFVNPPKPVFTVVIEFLLW